MSRTSFLREALTFLALTVALAAACMTWWRYAELRELASRTAVGHARATFHDRLIGAEVNLHSMVPGEIRHMPTSRASLVWILDLERCHGCFDSIAPWLQLEQLDDHDLFLLLSGDVSQSVQGRIRALRRTQVIRVNRDSVAAAIGNAPPSVKLFLAADGVALLVDGRASGQDCGWSFEAQVGALLGITPASAVRTRVDARVERAAERFGLEDI